MGDDSKPLIPLTPGRLPKIPSLPPRDTDQIPPLADCRDTAEVAPLDLAALTRELDKQGRASESSALSAQEPAIAVSGELGAAAATASVEAPGDVASEPAVSTASGDASSETERHVSVAALDASRAAGASSKNTRADLRLRTVPVRALRDPRTIAIGAMVVAGVCVIVTIGTIVWARNAVATAERASAIARTAAQVTSEPAPPKTPEPVEAAHAPVEAAQTSVEVTPGRAAPTAPAGAVVEPTPDASAPAATAPAQPAPSGPPVANVSATAQSTAPTAATCSIDVRSNVRDATVRVDGKTHGTAPTTVPAACDTLARVEVRHPRYEDFKREVTVKGRTDINARLEREKTKLTVWSHPEGAQVTYNGTVIGKTPLVAKVNRYEQGTLWFRAPGYKPDWRRILPKEKTKTVTISLVRGR